VNLSYLSARQGWRTLFMGPGSTSRGILLFPGKTTHQKRCQGDRA
jgi:hypothetical protein